MRPNTDLTIVITDAAGNTKTLDSNASHPGDIPQGIGFATQLGSGFHTGGFTLNNPIDRERSDLNLRDDIRIIGADGDTAYEGFIAEMPRSTSDSGGILTINTAGYMADTARASFREIFVDRDLTQWGPISRVQRVNNIAAGYANHDPAVISDQALPAVRTTFQGAWIAAGLPISAAMYDAGPGNRIGSVYYEWTRGQHVSSGGDPNYTWAVSAMTSDNTASGADDTGDLQSAGPGSGLLVTTAARRFAMIRLEYGVAGGSAGAEYNVDWSRLAVYGDHGIPQVGAAQPYAMSASRVISYLVQKHCPKLNTAGVQETLYPIEHLAFKERTRVYDALLKVNSYHLWDLAVWEDRTLHFKPISLEEWDYEIRHDEVGNQVGLQGDSVENLRNGIIVSFTNVATGSVEELHPDDYSQLRDSAIDNPFTAHGDVSYGDPYSIPFPTTLDNALELGRIKLAEDLQVKAPGAFTIQGHVKDRAGKWVPAWKIRAGDRIRLTSSASLSDRPRLVAETQYSHDTRSVTVAVDSTLRFLEGYVDRITSSIQAAGFSV